MCKFIVPKCGICQIHFGKNLNATTIKISALSFLRSDIKLISSNFNVSKTGVSSSIKNKRGSYNFLKPNYSSFKLGGVQVRGKNAATFQMIYMVLILIVNSIKILWHLSVSFLWFGFLATKWLVDFSIGFVKGFKTLAQ